MATEEDKALRRQSKKAERTPDQDRMALRRKVRIFYDIQRLRLQTAGRTYERPDGTEIHLHEVEQDRLARLEHRPEVIERFEFGRLCLLPEDSHGADYNVLSPRIMPGLAGSR